jgi:hypothetical protein
MNNTLSSSKLIAFITDTRKAPDSEIARPLGKNHDLIAPVGTVIKEQAGGKIPINRSAKP